MHSPFVYDFVTKCLYDKKTHQAYFDLNNYRNSLKTSKVQLEINDFGEGSKTLGSKTRKVSKMVQTSSSSKKEARLLYRVAKYFNLNAVLELGTSLGMGTYAFALANKDSKITTIEGCKNTSNFTQSQFQNLGINHINFKIDSFSSEIEKLDQTHFDCIYFDGHHNKSATTQYFEALLPKAHNDSIFIFDDIYWSKEMTEAWEYIKSHNAVTVTVDCFHLGFVFFRKEQEKEHFKIRM
ncbi:MAG: class I SAM-dependent methyltransferase [Winogradskyella sp.]